ncbi:MAG: glutamate synthase large subunit [Blastocatellia bacterium]|nr:glutamate synthase large subunit [Blastocatellia bacterium]MCS7157989.1 glutamate synthase large subunit [Blastocatellia bacterium]MCX7752496.1 glutamate synthase large subunit [Blastocatellia bacterium]MDW8167389.1 glutamate synthase large subunit [Acidobacteriota bacterium]MDW8257433.1 glutamate synthase large subunit [Acidobacteriota bacterium]
MEWSEWREGERDACGVGFVADLRGTTRHEILPWALEALSRLQHRGAVSADAETGDGAGVLFQLPQSFFRREAARRGARLCHTEKLAVGMAFLPAESAALVEARRVIETVVNKWACRPGRLPVRWIGWRPVPVVRAVLGESAAAECPTIEQFLISSGEEPCSGERFERELYLIRKHIERRMRELSLSTYIVSLSHRTIVYKGLMVSSQLGRFYPDLQNRSFKTAFAIFHQRYSTNTLPRWALAQPFRMLAHNGEINTLQGNRNWMRAREAHLRESLWGEEAEELLPILWEEGSDSANLDNVLELLVLSGRSLLHAMMMLVPEAYEGIPDLDEDVRAFYEYHECLMEPWDGPAALCFSDGRIVGAALDRNGLRPARYVVTDDGLVLVASEVGVLPLREDRIVEKGRLGPGTMLAVDTVRRELLRDEEIKRAIATRRPYARWIRTYLVKGPSEGNCGPSSAYEDAPGTQALVRRQRAFGYTIEDLDFLLGPMISEGKEPTGSMGDDTPLSVFSERPRSLYTYFRQRFAQVTNPPIDPLRERLVMSLSMLLGARGPWLEESPEACRLVKLRSPILDDEGLAWVLRQYDGRWQRLEAVFPISDGPSGLRSAVRNLCADAERAVREGASLLLLSDRAVDAARAPIPMLLAIGAVHHHLIRCGLRLRASLIAETDEPREDHHFACLLGYGASAVYPSLAMETVRAMARERGADPIEALQNYVRALEKGLLKITSKMGISTLLSYHGAQVFEAIGLARDLVDECFAGTPSRIGGISYEGVAEDVLRLHDAAFRTATPRLEDHGFYRFRQRGEYHAFHPGVIRALQRAVRGNERDAFRAYVRTVEEGPPVALRDLLDFRRATVPLSIEEVEPIEAIVRRFSTSAMSHGALSREAHEAIAIAMNRLGARSNSGEGGEDPERYRPRPDGDWPNSAIKQVASARFGVTPEYLCSALELEIKMAQGSKPGEGGQLPGHKVTPEIARIRHTLPGITLISPPPHHDIYSIEDLAQLIYDLRQVNPMARIAVKLVAEAGIGTIAAGVAKAGADVIHISGHDGGTGASPLGSIKYAGIPWELGVSEVHRALCANGLRERVSVRVDGGLKTGRDVLVAALLGADEFGFGTAALVALGCVMARRCHLNTCPVGIASQREDLRARFPGRPEHLERFLLFIAEQVRELLAALGVRRLDEIIGRTELLIPKEIETKGEDPSLIEDSRRMAPLLHRKVRLFLDEVLRSPVRWSSRESAHFGNVRRVESPLPSRGARTNPLSTLDERLVLEVKPALEGERTVRLRLPIQNTDRAVGARIAGEIARRYGDAGLPGTEIELQFRGSAGQSFGAFCLPGMRLILIGEANDYVGKGMRGGEIIVRPPENAAYVWHESVIMGNTVLYGATGGRLFAAGRAGERFAVRNSGAIAVVEGVGDHGCEYMTGGIVLVLGEVGRNFGAGMTGGLAFVFDEREQLPKRCNPELVDLRRLRAEDEELVRRMLQEHLRATTSPRAQEILDRWEELKELFWKVIPLTADEHIEASLREQAFASLGGDEVSEDVFA